MRSRAREERRRLGKDFDWANLGAATAAAVSRRVLVIGYGNPLRCDDGLGPRVAEALRDTTTCTAAVLHQLNPEHAELVAGADVVIFVDASRSIAAGAVEWHRVSAGPCSDLAHRSTPGALLRLAEELFGARPEAYEIVVGGASFELGESLSPAVAERLQPLIGFVRRTVLRLAVDKS